ncbi:uncharacterized protein METZ01_LOCUS103690 [marine metagenome]|uniref:Uncharacterized protein n=1 Tax=marine metagenome TaxID=408172 RepID=A0A381WE82_9ZZZZ
MLHHRLEEGTSCHSPWWPLGRRLGVVSMDLHVSLSDRLAHLPGNPDCGPVDGERCDSTFQCNQVVAVDSQS